MGISITSSLKLSMTQTFTDIPSEIIQDSKVTKILQSFISGSELKWVKEFNGKFTPNGSNYEIFFQPESGDQPNFCLAICDKPMGLVFDTYTKVVIQDVFLYKFPDFTGNPNNILIEGRAIGMPSAPPTGEEITYYILLGRFAD